MLDFAKLYISKYISAVLGAFTHILKMEIFFIPLNLLCIAGTAMLCYFASFIFVMFPLSFFEFITKIKITNSTKEKVQNTATLILFLIFIPFALLEMEK